MSTYRKWSRGNRGGGRQRGASRRSQYHQYGIKHYQCLSRENSRSIPFSHPALPISPFVLYAHHEYCGRRPRFTDGGSHSDYPGRNPRGHLAYNRTTWLPLPFIVAFNPKGAQPSGCGSLGITPGCKPNRFSYLICGHRVELYESGGVGRGWCYCEAPALPICPIITVMLSNPTRGTFPSCCPGSPKVGHCLTELAENGAD